MVYIITHTTHTQATSEELAAITKSDGVNTQFTIFDQNDCVKIVKDILKENNLIKADDGSGGGGAGE